jgi:hypothetical protein
METRGRPISSYYRNISKEAHGKCMIAQTKIDAVREYLRSEFHGFEVCDVYYEFGEVDKMVIERNFRKFQIVNYPTTYVVKLERLFLDDTLDVKKTLADIELGKVMRFNEGKQVLVTKVKGLVIL